MKIEIDVYDKSGNLKDWRWLVEEFGPVTVEVVEEGGWRVVELREEIGPANLNVFLLDKSGNLAEHIPVLWSDPQHNYEEYTNAFGRVGFAMGRGSYYKPPNQGPNWTTVDGGRNSEIIMGLGMIGKTTHRHLNVTFQYFEPDAPEPPPSPDCKEYISVLERIREEIDTICPR